MRDPTAEGSRQKGTCMQLRRLILASAVSALLFPIAAHATLTIALRRQGRTFSTIRTAVGPDARALTVDVPKAARHPGRYVLGLTARVDGQQEAANVTLTFVARHIRR